MRPEGQVISPSSAGEGSGSGSSRRKMDDDRRELQALTMPADPFAQLREVLSFRDKLKKRLNNVRADIFQSFFANETGPEVKKLKDAAIHPQESAIFLSAVAPSRATINPALSG